LFVLCIRTDYFGRRFSQGSEQARLGTHDSTPRGGVEFLGTWPLKSGYPQLKNNRSVATPVRAAEKPGIITTDK
jgi:hypothetical protein